MSKCCVSIGKLSLYSFKAAKKMKLNFLFFLNKDAFIILPAI